MLTEVKVALENQIDVARRFPGVVFVNMNAYEPAEH
jgi:hypothetical protein